MHQLSKEKTPFQRNSRSTSRQRGKPTQRYGKDGESEDQRQSRIPQKNAKAAISGMKKENVELMEGHVTNAKSWDTLQNVVGTKQQYFR